MNGKCIKGSLLVLVICLGSAAAAFAQRTQSSKTPDGTLTPGATPTPSQSGAPVKRNERPAGTGAADAGAVHPVADTVYVYEFERPGFVYARVRIEHDASGKGAITFQKDASEEWISDPIQLSTLTLANIDRALEDLRFLDSNENYQTERDHSNMGNISLTLKRGGRSRTATFNWTDVAGAKMLMDEYRRISNEYTWRFEMTVGRENQPLQTPTIMATLSSYIQRHEISDPSRLLPFLDELSTDERLPLMARNRAAVLVKEIRKQKK